MATDSPQIQTHPELRRIALLAGGAYGEREVSLASGQSATEALRQAGHTVLVLDPQEADFIEKLRDWQPDVVFIALHGRGGEDGSIQGLLELLELPYTGSGVLASALAMDKERSKIFYQMVGLETPDSVAIEQNMAGLAAAQAFVDRHGWPVVVKPANGGSSLGISIVRRAADLPAALDHGFAVSPRLLVERFIAGTEVTIPVLGNQQLQALPVIEIIPHREFYDYEAKYAAGGSDHIIPARLSPALLEHCQQQAMLAHRVLGCAGVSRSDFIVDAMGTAWIMETNTIPGMTRTSLLPDAARKGGMTDIELYNQIVELGLAAHPRAATPGLTATAGSGNC
ncbi:MAG: D-alanine--D-alanine ligase [Actinomycetia bacterium]|nr:D-alanine--D-alanine ligase [Actinomycetes bacterium]